MDYSILIAVCDGYNGSGNFLFALKLASKMQKYYTNLFGGNSAPEVKLIIEELVMEESAIEKIHNLKRGSQFEEIEVLSLDKLKALVIAGQQIMTVVEGPVFKSAFIKKIDDALDGQRGSIPLIMVPEYTHSEHGHFNNQRKYRQTRLRNLNYSSTIYTGLDTNTNERGIILSDCLLNPEEPSILQIQLDPKIKLALMGTANVNTYKANTDLYFQYSYDMDLFKDKPDIRKVAGRYLAMHRIVAKDGSKNQDILMIGRNDAAKLAALQEILPQLIQDGYASICFYNVDTPEFPAIFARGTPNSEGRRYRVLYTSKMSHASMIASQALSCDLMGATGDQSFGEAISGDKIIIYEPLDHKVQLCNSYYQQLKKIDPVCTEVLDLFKNACEQSAYTRLEELLTSEIKLRLKLLSQKFRESVKELAQSVTIATMFGERSLNSGAGDKIFHAFDNFIFGLTDQRQFCEKLKPANQQAKSLFGQFSKAVPNKVIMARIRYMHIRFRLEEYVPKLGTKRATMQDIIDKFISTFSMLENKSENESALIGLLLLITQNIKREYLLFSPKVGLFFGSKFFSILEAILKELDFDLKNVSTEKRQPYYHIAAGVTKRNPQLLINNTVIELFKEAGIDLRSDLNIMPNSQELSVVEQKPADEKNILRR